MYFPNEIFQTIVRSLRRTDLKAARLVSPAWRDFASPLLFDRIYVAPNKLDFETFEAICRDRILSNCVHRLIYDGAEFIANYNKRRYIKDLQSQTRQILGETTDGLSALDVGGSERIARMEDARPAGLDLDDLEVKWGNAGLITQGHRKYLEHARYQQNAILSGYFNEGLVQGLKLLPSLESISLEGGWPRHIAATLSEHGFGSPLARTWDPLHPYPQRWYYGPSNDGFSNGVCHHQIITTALVRAKKQIYDFTVGGNSLLPAMPSEIVGGSYDPSHSITGLDALTFTQLVRVSLKIEHWDDRTHGNNREKSWDLPKLLGSMKSLRRLDLILPRDANDNPLTYRFNQVFPQHTKWDSLATMVLHGVSSGITELLNLILFRMPALTCLELGELELRDGTWEAVIESLQQSRQLSSFNVARGSRLLYDGDSLSGAKLFDYSFKAIEDYVLHGGRHPCLQDYQLDTAASLYVMDENIESGLRERIIGAEA